MKIANRYRPFSHLPGTSCLIPGSDYIVAAYPTACLFGRDENKMETILWELTGPIKGFTVMQDLEKARIIVYGHAKEGYFQYQLYWAEEGIKLQVDRVQGALKGTLNGVALNLKPKESFYLTKESKLNASHPQERISFGSHKKQDWELVSRRKNPIEYLPFWFALGQYFNSEATVSEEGALKLLKACREEPNKNKAFEDLCSLFEVGFEKMMVPRLYDSSHLGLVETGSSKESKPIELLHEGYKLIRGMLLKEKENQLELLPFLPSELHAGRCLGFKVAKASCNFEWSKKLLKKVVFTVHEPKTFQLVCQKELKTCRIRRSSYTKGEVHPIEKPLTLEKGIYILDQFKK